MLYHTIPHLLKRLYPAVMILAMQEEVFVKLHSLSERNTAHTMFMFMNKSDMLYLRFADKRDSKWETLLRCWDTTHTVMFAYNSVLYEVYMFSTRHDSVILVQSSLSHSLLSFFFVILLRFIDGANQQNVEWSRCNTYFFFVPKHTSQFVSGGS